MWTQLLSKLLPVLVIGLGFNLPANCAESVAELEDGTPLKILFFQPEPRSDVDSWPLAILVPGGSGDEYMARAQFWLGSELRDRGWAIAVPISDEITSIKEDGGRLLPQLISYLDARNPLSSRRALLVGISSGGSVALKTAASGPQDYLGVIAVPGRLLEDDPIVALDNLPVYLRMGAKDPYHWQRTLGSIESRLTSAGATVDAKLVPDGKHIFGLDLDELDAWLETLSTGQ